MSRYIDADKLRKDEIARCHCVPCVGSNDNNYKDLDEVLNDAPTADVVEVRHGRWLSAYEYAIKLGETNQYRLGIAEHDKIWHFCSLCEQQVRFERNFCPECGAKMDGERREG